MALSQDRRETSCTTDPGTKIYSNVKYVEEAGDVIGLELALGPIISKKVDVLLYVYEGTPTTKGMRLTGLVRGKTLVIDDTSSEHLVGSSGKDIVYELPVKISGTWDEKQFAGTVQINRGDPKAVELRRVEAIWLWASKR